MRPGNYGPAENHCCFRGQGGELLPDLRIVTLERLIGILRCRISQTFDVDAVYFEKLLRN